MKTDELAILGQFIYRTTLIFKYNIAHHLALHFRKVANTGNANVLINIGGLITHIAKKQGNFPEQDFNYITGPIYMDLVYLGCNTPSLQTRDVSGNNVETVNVTLKVTIDLKEI